MKLHNTIDFLVFYLPDFILYTKLESCFQLEERLEKPAGRNNDNDEHNWKTQPDFNHCRQEVTVQQRQHPCFISYIHLPVWDSLHLLESLNDDDHLHHHHHHLTTVS